jgi:Arc/MetJ-type ribon-helix-helix transcriptional regulator
MRHPPTEGLTGQPASKARLTLILPPLTLEHMEVQLTDDQRAFVRQAIETGRLHRAEEAVEEAMALWEERERTRAEILASIDRAEASLARGEGRAITEQSMRELADETKKGGRTRLAAGQATPR